MGLGDGVPEFMAFSQHFFCMSLIHVCILHSAYYVYRSHVHRFQYCLHTLYEFQMKPRTFWSRKVAKLRAES
jgi:hypothetical protein